MPYCNSTSLMAFMILVSRDRPEKYGTLLKENKKGNI
jgi:hypothetical protein